MPVNFRPDFTARIVRPTRIAGTRPIIRLPSGPRTPVDAVFEGGGALGSAYIGSLTMMEQARLSIARVAGNSAGAIVSAMVAAGYSAADIAWLCSSFPNQGPRPAGVPATLNPIDFLDFLDLPSLNTIGTAARRRTLFWKLVKGQVLDTVLAQRIPVPTRSSARNSIISGLKALPVIGGLIAGPVETSVRGVLNTTLGFLPATQPRLRDFQLFDTEPLRIAFADAVWSAVASVNPALILSTQLIYEGSLFEGRNFLDTMQRVLGAKVHNNPGATVLFSQLPIPLALIGSNIRTGRMEVYSSATHPNMDVAEAVRRTMSLPLIFEPRGNVVVDGGLCSNLPAWLFTAAGDRYWPTTSIDPARPKLAFSLDERMTPPNNWGAAAGKFPLTGNPPAVNITQVLTPLLIARLREAGLYVPTPQLPQSEVNLELDNWKLLQVAMGSFGMNSEESVRGAILKAMFDGQHFTHVEIPLSGFHWLDFALNSDEDDLDAIAERGWFATRDGLAQAPAGHTALLANPANFANPFS